MVLFFKFYCGLHTKTNLQLNDKKKYKGMCSEFMHTDKNSKGKLLNPLAIPKEKSLLSINLHANERTTTTNLLEEL